MLIETGSYRGSRGAGALLPRIAQDRAAGSRVAVAAARGRWLTWYRVALVAVDLVVAVVAGAAMVFSGAAAAANGISNSVWLSLGLPALWPLVQALSGSYSPTVTGTGSEEFRRVTRGGLLLLAGISVVSYAGQLEISRSFVLFTVPAMAVATLLSRVGARKALAWARRRGHCIKRVVAVGRDAAVADLVLQLQRERHAGMQVVAACVTTPPAAARTQATGVPVEGDLDSVVDVLRRRGADAVAVTSSSETAAVYLRRLSWQLEGSGVELLVSPGLMEVAGPRLHIRPFEGLPLLSVEQPRFEGWRRVVKGGIDRAVAATALLVFSPVLLLIACAVRLDSPGPVLFRQERVGLNGRSFTMLKFRSMVVDADERLAALRSENISDGLLFKLRDDPRVTRVGRWLRRLSLDELPQLLNVLTGAMSLVGPRPPLPVEVQQYDDSVRRRLLVKPGLTGLWQISGRSDLPWEEAVRLDLRYVENWSLAVDLLILWKTGRAVLSRSGAY